MPYRSMASMLLAVGHNGTSEPGELVPARKHLTRIGLGYMREDGNADKHGNVFLFTAAGPSGARPLAAARNGTEHEARLIEIYDVFLSMVNMASGNH